MKKSKAPGTEPFDLHNNCTNRSETCFCFYGYANFLQAPVRF
jgi:hypothetical protein